MGRMLCFPADAGGGGFSACCKNLLQAAIAPWPPDRAPFRQSEAPADFTDNSAELYEP